jgi:tetratricopeptide (TPR) repeat protein
MTRERNPETGSVVLDAEALPLVARIADELRAARTLAPTFGPPHALEGVLRLWTLDEPEGAALIENGYRLAPYDARACLAMAELCAREDRADEAFAALRRAVQLESGALAAATEMCLAQLDRPELAEELAVGNHQRLNWLAAQYAKEPRYAARVEPVRALAEQTLRQAAASDAATAGEMAAVAALDAQAGELEESVQGYRRALGLNYSQIGWRLRLAQLLVELERYDEAVREARICLRLKPGLKGAEDIVGEHGR